MLYIVTFAIVWGWTRTLLQLRLVAIISTIYGLHRNIYSKTAQKKILIRRFCNMSRPIIMTGLDLQNVWMISYKPRKDWRECGAGDHLHEYPLSETLIENN